MDVLAPLAIGDCRRCQHMDVLAPLAIGDRRSPEVPTPNIEVFLKCGVAPIGVKQHIFGATVFVCVCGCCMTGKPKTIIANTHGEQISDTK